jgi:hypothetical protein
LRRWWLLQQQCERGLHHGIGQLQHDHDNQRCIELIQLELDVELQLDHHEHLDYQQQYEKRQADARHDHAE